MREKIERLLADRRLPAIAALVAMALVLPALGAGLFADDIVHQATFAPGFRLPGGILGDWDMFRFQGADRDNFRLMLDYGIWPWWAAPALRLAFFRPLTALTHAVDYRLLAAVPAAMHAESIALYGGLTFAAACCYRRLLAPAWAAGFASLLFAADQAHALPVVWLANRNALISALFGFCAIALHDRARREGGRRAAILAPGLYALGLLGGEAAVATLAYLAAHALFVDEAPWPSRLRGLAPYAVVTTGWAVVYHVLGYGAHGSGYYVDPGSEPVAFAGALVVRLPQLLLAQLVAPSSNLWLLLPADRMAMGLVAATLALACIAWVMARVLGRDRRAAFFATGMLLSLVPMCAVFPNDRLLLFSGLGAFGLIALFFARLVVVIGRGARAAGRALAVAFFVVHVAASPVLLTAQVLGFAAIFHDYVGRGDQTMPRCGPGATLIIVNAPDTLVAPYVLTARRFRGEPTPDRMRLLSIAVGTNDGEIVRRDTDTLVMTLRDGFVNDPFSRLARGDSVPFHVGETSTVGGMTATVEALTTDGRPQRVRFRFDRPLDDPTFAWTAWDGAGFVPMIAPAVGERRPVRGIDYLASLTGT